jgi:hypothetical protein
MVQTQVLRLTFLRGLLGFYFAEAGSDWRKGRQEVAQSVDVVDTGAEIEMAGNYIGQLRALPQERLQVDLAVLQEVEKPVDVVLGIVGKDSQDLLTLVTVRGNVPTLCVFA